MTAMVSDQWTRELKKGGIQLCILALLREERKYGFQIIKELRERTGGFFDLKEGTLYPALHRLEKRGFVVSEWVMKGDKPRKYYSITQEGLRELEKASKEWERMVESVRGILEVRK